MNSRVVRAGESTDSEGKGLSLKNWKPIAHSADSRNSSHLPGHTQGAAQRSTGAGGAEAAVQGQAMTREGPAQAGHRMLALM